MTTVIFEIDVSYFAESLWKLTIILFLCLRHYMPREIYVITVG